MVTKAIVKSIEEDGYSFKVRIPIFHKIENVPGATPDSELPIAPCCIMPGVFPNIAIGDIVWVAFENEEYSDPVIIGVLYNEKSKYSSSSLRADSAIVEVDFIDESKNSNDVSSIPSVATQQTVEYENSYTTEQFPSELRIINPPIKNMYWEGELLTTEGALVVGYVKNSLGGREKWKGDANHPNGIIPLDELSISPIIAKYEELDNEES